MGQITNAAAIFEGKQALETLGQINKQIHQIGGQMQNTASVYVRLRAKAEDASDEAFFDQSLQASIASVKTQLDATPVADKAMIHRVLNGVFGCNLETDPNNL